MHTPYPLQKMETSEMPYYGDENANDEPASDNWSTLYGGGGDDTLGSS